jgi:hypothetical protein
VLPFAADGEGAGRQPPERSANHGCSGGGLGGSDPETLQAWCVGEEGTVLFSLFLFCGSVSIFRLFFSFLRKGAAAPGRWTSSRRTER